MKRLTTLLLSLAMVLTIAGCGGGTGEPDVEVPQEDAGEPAPGPTGELLPPFSTEAVIEETVLVDEDNVRITATALEYSGLSADLKLTIENNSGEDLCFTSGTLANSCNSVNGMMVEDGYLNCDVPAGKKTVDTVSFGYVSLQLCGIQEIAEIELGMSAADENVDRTDYPLKPIRTSAWSESGNQADYRKTITSAAAQNTFDYEVLSFTEDRFNANTGAAVLSQTLIKNADGEQNLLVEAENQIPEMCALAISNIVLNDLLVEPGTWSIQTIAPGRRGILSIELDAILEEKVWELYGIDEIGSISFDLQPYRMDSLPAAEKETIRMVCGDAHPIDDSGEILYQEHELSVISKAVLGPDDGLGMDFKVMLLAENKGQDPVKLTMPYDTLSVNGYMVDNFENAWELKAGQSALLEIELSESDLDEIGITETEQFSQVQFTLEISCRQTVLDRPVILMAMDEA